MIKISKIIYDYVFEHPQSSILQLIEEPYPIKERKWVITEELNLPYIEGLLVGIDKQNRVRGFEIEAFPLLFKDIINQLQSHSLPYRFLVSELGLTDVPLTQLLQACYARYVEPETKTETIEKYKTRLLSLIDGLSEWRIRELLDYAEFLREKESFLASRN